MLPLSGNRRLGCAKCCCQGTGQRQRARTPEDRFHGLSSLVLVNVRFRTKAGAKSIRKVNTFTRAPPKKGSRQTIVFNPPPTSAGSLEPSAPSLPALSLPVTIAARD
jgi:hypothetical protein